MRRKFFLRCTKPLHKEKTCKQEPARRKLKKNLRSKTEPRRGSIPLSIKQKKCSVIKTEHFFVIGGAEGNRTPDLLNAIEALSQLSYNPISDGMRAYYNKNF